MLKNFSTSTVLISMFLFLFFTFLNLFLMYFSLGAEMFIEWNIFQLNNINLNMVIIVDYVSIFFLSLVSLITSSVMYYSSSYMKEEIYFSRFNMILILFLFSMYLLIMSPNLISLLLGWDGLGVTSYLLVIFYQSNKSYNAGMITALTNRLGDIGILLSILFIGYSGDWSLSYMGNSTSIMPQFMVIIVILAACTKSAQVPFSSWLPAAMAAPTPVSALVHSSTLVTAGIYVLVRFNNLIMGSLMMQCLILLGLLTSLMAGVSAMFESDMKKIIALSTLSQLGIMMMTLGVYLPILSYYHMLSHAYFKAMLFMCAGSVIHSMKDYQDMRKMGGVNLSEWVVISIMSVANLSLCGIPFMSGYYSKDLILEIIMMSSLNIMLFLAMMISTFLTLLYSFRLMFSLGLNHMKLDTMYSSTKVDTQMLFGMFMLVPFSIGGGSMLSWSIMSTPQLIYYPFWMKLLLLSLFFMTYIISKLIYFNFSPYLFSPIKMFMGNMWCMPLTFSNTNTYMSLYFSKLNNKIVEMSWLEHMLFISELKIINKMKGITDSMNTFNLIFLGLMLLGFNFI